MNQPRNLTAANPNQHLNPVPVVRWLFTRDGQALTCQVGTDNAGSSYEVAIVPHWDVALAVVEDAPTPANALQRHAQIAMMLRDAGWSVARHSA